MEAECCGLRDRCTADTLAWRYDFIFDWTILNYSNDADKQRTEPR